MRLIRLLKRDLAREAHDWVEDGLINEDQGKAICQRYGIDYQHPDEQGFGHGVLVVLGYLFIGLSLITLIGANWEEIPRGLRTGGLVLLVLLTNLRGWFSLRAGQRAAAVGWFFLGSLFYGAAIMLIAQIWHIGEHYPDGILWWALGVLPVAVLLESGLITALMLVLAFTWFFVESGLGFFPGLFPLFIAAGLWQLRRGAHSTLIFLAVVAAGVLYLEYGLSWWLQAGIGYDFTAENLLLVAGLFVILQALAQCLMAQTSRPLAPLLVDYGTVLQLWVLRFFLILLLVLSFTDPWQHLMIADWEHPWLGPVIALVCAVPAIGFVIVRRMKLWPVLPTGLVYLGLGLAAWWVDDRALGQWFAVADNLILVGFGVALIVYGINARISHYFYTGVSAILLTGLLRYIDLIGDYIGAAILFAVFAAILLGAARYWKHSHKEAVS